MSFIDRIYQANTARLHEYSPLLYNNRAVGLLWQPQIELLECHGLDVQSTQDGYTFDPAKDCQSLSRLLADTIASLSSAGMVPGWRNEQYALAEDYHSPPVALIERAAMPIFGGCGYGVHVNGLTMKNGMLHIWIAQRSWDKPTEPGKLDQIAAGGMPYGISAFKNMQKECSEEASIPASLSATAKSVGTSSYFYQVENGIRADVLFNYDLWLPEDFIPTNSDGEVAGFMCLPVSEVMDMVCNSDTFKFNASIVLIDLFVRHGYLKPSHGDYEKICGMLNPRYTLLSSIFKPFSMLK